MLRRLVQSETGAELIEFALIGTLLLFLLLGATDYARVYHTAIQLNNGARAGAQYGARSLASSSDLTGMQTVATQAVTLGGVTATASRLCQCASDGGTFSSTTPPNSCLTPPATSCPANGNRVVTVTVTTSATFSMMSVLPGIPQVRTFTRSATMRVPEF